MENCPKVIKKPKTIFPDTFCTCTWGSGLEYFSSIQVLSRETGTYASDRMMKQAVFIAIYLTPQN